MNKCSKKLKKFERVANNKKKILKLRILLTIFKFYVKNPKKKKNKIE